MLRTLLTAAIAAASAVAIGALVINLIRKNDSAAKTDIVTDENSFRIPIQDDEAPASPDVTEATEEETESGKPETETE